MASGTIKGSGNPRLRIVWSSSQNGQNSTLVTATLYSVCDYSINYSATKTGSLTIGGQTTPFSYGGGQSSPSAVAICTASCTIGNGGTSCSFSASYNIAITYSGNYIATLTLSGSGTLDTLTKTAPGTPEWGPSVSPSSALPGTSLSISWGGGGGFGMSGTYAASFDHCDIQWNWNSTSWGDIGNVGGFSTTATMPNIPGGTLQFRVCVYNNFGLCGGWVYSPVISCLGGSIVSSMPGFAADTASVSIYPTITVYNTAFTHNIYLIDSSSGGAVISWSAYTFSASGAQTLTLTSAQRTALLAYMNSPSTANFNAYIAADTFNGGAQVGGRSSSAVFGVTTSQAVSGPSLAAFTFADINATTAAITGTSGAGTWLIKGYSTLQVSPGAGTTKNGASITKYVISIDTLSVSQSTNATVTMGAVNSSGSLPCTVTVTDTRGYTCSVIIYINVAGYNSIYISTAGLVLARNGYGTATTLTLTGVLSQITINSANKNAFALLQYRYKQSGQPDTSYTNWATLAATSTATMFSFSTSALIGDQSGSNGFGVATDYIIQLQTTDKLTGNILTYTLPKAIPLLTFENTMVGINNPSPTCALDVVGSIALSGVNIFSLIYPVGCIYLSVASANPGTLFGGTWVAWGTGMVPVDINTNDSNFNTVEKTGGEEAHVLSEAELAAHSHGGSTGGQSADHHHTGTTDGMNQNNPHGHGFRAVQDTATGSGGGLPKSNNSAGSNTGWSGYTAWNSANAAVQTQDINHGHTFTTGNKTANHTHGISSDGSNSAHNNLQPYITCYMWKRTA